MGNMAASIRLGLPPGNPKLVGQVRGVVRCGNDGFSDPIFSANVSWPPLTKIKPYGFLMIQ